MELFTNWIVIINFASNFNKYMNSTCFEEYCRSLIMNGSADRMMCPSVGCYSKISDE